MIDGFSLGSIVEQMKSDGRSFEEIQSVVREYKRRKDSKPVVDLVGVTMEDKPLQEFEMPVKEEKPNRWVQIPYKQKNGETGYNLVWEDEYENVYSQLDDFQGVSFEQYAKNNNATINVEDIENRLPDAKAKEEDPTVTAYKKEIADIRKNIVPEKYPKQIVDYIFSGYKNQPEYDRGEYVDGQEGGEKKIQKAVVNPLELPGLISDAYNRLGGDERPALPADLAALVDEKGRDNITVDDIPEAYAENIYNFINQEKKIKVDQITGNYKRDLGLTDDMVTKLELDALPEELSIKSQQISDYNQSIKNQYIKDLSYLGYNEEEINYLIAKMELNEVGTYRIPFSDPSQYDQDVLNYPGLGGFSIGKTKTEEAFRNVQKDQTPKFGKLDLTKKYQLLRFDREGEINEYLNDNSKVYDNFVRELDKQKAFVDQKSAPYFNEMKALNTQIEVLESRDLKREDELQHLYS